MSFAALTMAAGLLAGQSSAAAAIQTFADACLTQTPVSREALNAMASARRWDVGGVETPSDLEWRDVYRAGTAIVRLDQHRVSSDSNGERICVVYIGPAPAGWIDRVSSLSANGVTVGPPGEYDRAVYQMPEGVTLTVWDLADGSRIHALTTLDNELELSVNYPPKP